MHASANSHDAGSPVFGKQHICFGLPVLVLIVQGDAVGHSVLHIKLTHLWQGTQEQQGANERRSQEVSPVSNDSMCYEACTELLAIPTACLSVQPSLLLATCLLVHQQQQ